MITTMLIAIPIAAFIFIGIMSWGQKKAYLRILKNAQNSATHLSIISNQIKELEYFYLLAKTINTQRDDCIQVKLIHKNFAKSTFQIENLN